MAGFFRRMLPKRFRKERVVIPVVRLSGVIASGGGPLRQSLNLAGVSQAIQPDWIADATERRSLPWEIAKWTVRGKAIVSTPVTGDNSTTPPQCYVVNLETGAWCKYTGWDTRTVVLHDDFVYFGTNDGTVMQAEITGFDDGELIYHNCVLSFDHFDRVGFYKTALEMRATFVTQTNFNPKLSVSTDYAISLSSAPDAATDSNSPGVWDVGLWDVALWDTGAAQFNVQTYWTGVGLSGTVHAPQVQVTSGSDQSPSGELVIMDVKIDDGDDTGS